MAIIHKDRLSGPPEHETYKLLANETDVRLQDLRLEAISFWDSSFEAIKGFFTRTPTQNSQAPVC